MSRVTHAMLAMLPSAFNIFETVAVFATLYFIVRERTTTIKLASELFCRMRSLYQFDDAIVSVCIILLNRTS